MKMTDYQPAKQNIKVSPGESVRILRELQELGPNQLAELTEIPPTTLLASY
jgi:hypothetical protein